MKNIQKITIILLALLAVILSGCSGVEGNIIAEDAKENEMIKITIAEMKAPVSSPMTLAYLMGYFEEEGLDVEVKSFSIARLGVDAMINGGADFGMAADYVTMNIMQNDNDIFTIGTYFQDDLGINIIGKKSSGITKLDDLKGKKVAAVVGTAHEVNLYSYAKSVGVKYDEISVVNMAVPDMPSALIKGDIDAYSSMEPFLTPIAKEIGDDAIIFKKPEIYTVTGHLLVNKNIAQNNSEIVIKYLRAVNKGINYLEQNPDEAKEMLAKYYNTDIETLELVLPNFGFQLDFNEEKIITELEEEFILAKEMGNIRNNAQMSDYRKYFYKKAFDSIQ